MAIKNFFQVGFELLLLRSQANWLRGRFFGLEGGH